MKLEDYLKAIRECPDGSVDFVDISKRKIERLTYEWGIYDNFPIHLNADFDSVVKYFDESKLYALVDVMRGIHLFDYTPGCVRLQVSPVTLGLLGSRIDGHNMTIMLHPYQDKEIKGISQMRAMALVVDDIGQFILKENIPARLTDAVGWKYIKDPDYSSRLVVHEPTAAAVSESRS